MTSIVRELSAVVAEEILELIARLIAGLEPEVYCPRALTPISHSWQLYSATFCLQVSKHNTGIACLAVDLVHCLCATF